MLHESCSVPFKFPEIYLLLIFLKEKEKKSYKSTMKSWERLSDNGFKLIYD